MIAHTHCHGAAVLGLLGILWMGFDVNRLHAQQSYCLALAEGLT
jgi:hypothetical protein